MIQTIKAKQNFHKTIGEIGTSTEHSTILKNHFQYFRHKVLSLGFKNKFLSFRSTLKNLLVKLYEIWNLFHINMDTGIDETELV